MTFVKNCTDRRVVVGCKQYPGDEMDMAFGCCGPTSHVWDGLPMYTHMYSPRGTRVVDSATTITKPSNANGPIIICRYEEKVSIRFCGPR